MGFENSDFRVFGKNEPNERNSHLDPFFIDKMILSIIKEIQRSMSFLKILGSKSANFLEI